MKKVVFEGKTYETKPQETILDTLIRGGANIPFSCRKGSCHTCMMKALDGTPDPSARKNIKSDMLERGYFLPCKSIQHTDMVISRPDPHDVFTRLFLSERVQCSPTVWKLSFESETALEWRAGQFVNLYHGEDPTIARSYSLASIAEHDYFLEFHIKVIPDGKLSNWLVNTLQPGDIVDAQGPLGDCTYALDDTQTPIRLIGTGTGLSPLIGVARDALLSGHQGPVALFHGAQNDSEFYLRDKLNELAEKHDNFTYTEVPHKEGSLFTDLLTQAFDEADESTQVYLAGSPLMVHKARVMATLQGIGRAQIKADPFEHSNSFVPNDKATLDSLEPDMELWEALDEGKGLTAILNDFYTRTYADPLLSPFFHNVTKQHAIAKQYAFLRLCITGGGQFLGLSPYNAHHWMVISDELFDYREALFDECVRRYGLEPRLQHQWAALHERFRPAIVKSKARGMIIDGEEIIKEGFVEEVIVVATVCDGCFEEICEGDRARLHQRTGKLYCSNCNAVDVM